MAAPPAFGPACAGWMPEPISVDVARTATATRYVLLKGHSFESVGRLTPLPKLSAGARLKTCVR
ncbi:hypothetical protein Asp14428_17680 [Actinoplanes sp. NBRC 14428]|nr:hypothetical protein Asp14428_17680 [Actinoplanes sp. NBRC 14428]